MCFHMAVCNCFNQSKCAHNSHYPDNASRTSIHMVHQKNSIKLIQSLGEHTNTSCGCWYVRMCGSYYSYGNRLCRNDGTNVAWRCAFSVYYVRLRRVAIMRVVGETRRERRTYADWLYVSAWDGWGLWTSIRVDGFREFNAALILVVEIMFNVPYQLIGPQYS